LRSKTDHGNFFIFDVVQIRVFIVVNLHISSCCVSGFAILITGTFLFTRVVEWARFCGIATFGCASNLCAAKSAQARVPVLLKAIRDE
jgi:hypothetical protein